jgi:hypothetical protein
MARAQELQEWFWENGKWSWWCHTHSVTASLHIKGLMFYPRNWDMAFYGTLQMHTVHVHFKKPMLYSYFGMGFGCIPYFIKMDSLYVK